MELLGHRCLEASPETLVVFTPHGLAIEGCISLSVARLGTGHVDGANGVRISMRFSVDVELASAIGSESERLAVHAAEVGFSPDGRPMELFPLDWGVLVPVYFLGAKWGHAPRLVVACPDRNLPRRELLAFGQAVVHAARRVGRRIAVVCSADQGHGHAEDGPYGFSPASAPHDAAYCGALRDNAMHRLLHWRSDRIEAALTDSYWQTLMLMGALKEAPLEPELLSYEAPTYFGMACAAFQSRGD